MNFFKLTISEIVKKIKKSTRQVNNGMGKTLFLRSQFERETGRPAETKGRRLGCSLKEWKDVANTQGFF